MKTRTFTIFIFASSELSADSCTKIYIRKDLDPRQCRKARRDEDIKCQRGSKEKEVLWGWVAREGSMKELRHE